LRSLRLLCCTKRIKGEAYESTAQKLHVNCAEKSLIAQPLGGPRTGNVDGAARHTLIQRAVTERDRERERERERKRVTIDMTPGTFVLNLLSLVTKDFH
jgi:hypothetical protein